MTVPERECPAEEPTRLHPLGAPRTARQPWPLETYLAMLLIALGPLVWWLIATLPGQHWWGQMICPAAWIAAVAAALGGAAVRERRLGRGAAR